MADDPISKLIEGTERYRQMLEANLAASLAERERLDNEAPLSPVEIALRRSDSADGERL